VNGARIQVLRFADDIVIKAQDEINLKSALENLDDILKCNYKMKINGKKAEVMVCSLDSEYINIKMDDNALKQVPNFKYLSIIITEVGKNEKYTIQRIKESEVVFNNKRQLLCKNNLSV